MEGFRLLRVIGKPSAAGARATELGFESTTRLVTVGAYRFIRHPMYASLLALRWCAYLKDPLVMSRVALALGVTAFLMATAVAEERENRERFGEAYVAYMRRTRRFVPFVFQRRLYPVAGNAAGFERGPAE